MRSAAIVVDSNAFRAPVLRDGELEFWSRFPLEIDGSNIVTPHLFAVARRTSRSPAACAIAAPAVFAAFAYRTKAYREYLVDEVVPRLSPTCPHIALVDSAERRFEVHGTEEVSPLADLPALLDRWTQTSAFAGVSFDAHLDNYEQFLGRATHRSDPAALGHRLERSPLRLWEALFSRGHTGRYELIDGQVVLVTELGTTLAANRTLMQCVHDAVTLCRSEPGEHRDWIHVGRFRFRQRAESLEIRVTLTAADLRVAFAPNALGAGANDLPSLIGVLLAGGDNGKTEMIDGYTWATVQCRDDAELATLSASVADEIAAWTGAAIDRSCSAFPSHRDGTWATRARPGRYSMLDVFVPMYRDDVLPWDAIS